MPGPVPKRSSERRRRNKEGATEAVTVEGAVEVPAGEEHWHPIAASWYESLAESGQSRFYEPSDWQTARYVAEAMHRNLTAGRFSAQAFAATMAAMTSLLVTEGDRRRARMEIERETGQVELPADVVAMDDYRGLLGG